MEKFSEQIVESLNKKEKIAWKYLYNVYYASLCHYAHRFVGEWKNEEDIVQEIFIKLWEGKGHFENTRALSTYLFRAVHNACLYFLRGQKEESLANLKKEDLPAFDSPNNEELLLEEEYYRQLFHALNSLPEQRRKIIEFSLQGKTNETIAAESGISINTVKTLKRKAYAQLREMLSDTCWMFFLTFL